MSRTGWAVLLLLGAAAGFALFLLDRPLPPHVRQRAEAARGTVQAAAQAVDAQRRRLEELIAADPKFLEGRPEVDAARAAVAAAEQAAAAVRERAEAELVPLAERDRHADAERLAAVAAELEVAAGEASARSQAALAEVETLLSYKRDHAAHVARAREAARRAAVQREDPALTHAVRLAAASYPEAAPALQRTLDESTAAAEQIARSAQALEALAAADPPDYVAVGRLARAVDDAATRLAEKRAALEKDVAELGRSFDKILVDMREDTEGDRARYFHKYKLIENGKATETDWVEVAEAEFRQHEPHLGMALYSKPEGVLPEDAVTVASPPGFAYVGNERFGRWQSDADGNRFWTFFGQYALLQTLLWGPGLYRPVGWAAWNDYRSHRGAGRPYFGPGKEYGTAGSVTRARYANSRYVSRGAAARAGRAGSRPQASPRPRVAPPRGAYRGSRFRVPRIGRR